MADERISESTPPRRRWDEGVDDQGSPSNVRKSGSSAGLWIVLAVVGVCLVLCVLPFLAGVGLFFMRMQGQVAQQAAVAEVRVAVAEERMAVAAKAQEDADGPMGVPMPAPPGPVPGVGPGPLPGQGLPIQAKPLDVIQAPAVRMALNAKSQDVKDVVFAPHANRVGHFGWEGDANKKRKYFDLWDWKERKHIARVPAPSEQGGFVAMSPNGTRLLAHQFNPKSINIWSLPDGKQLKKEWRPNANQPEVGAGGFDRSDLAWAAFLDEESLLTVAQSGRFDLWDANFEKTKYTVAKRRDVPFMIVNGFARGPQNMALSDDGNLLALANGDGYEFFDPFTGKAGGKTDSLAKEGRVGNTWSVAFNRDATLLATVHTISGGGLPSREFLTVWNVADGKRKSHFPIENHAHLKGPITWISAKHLLIWDSNLFRASVFNLDEARFERVLERGANGDRVARQGPDNRIWYTSSVAFAANAELLAVEFPADDLVKNPAPRVNVDQLPRWYVSPGGIGREAGIKGIR